MDKTTYVKPVDSQRRQKIARTSNRETPEEHPFHKVSCDILQLEESFNGDEYIIHSRKLN